MEVVVTQNREGPLSEAVAKRILARAAELDASERTGVSVRDLRTAAAEAGISERALDRAISEIASAPDPAATTARPRKSKKGLIAVAAVVVILGFWVTVFAARRIVVEEPAMEPVPEIVVPPR
jgi:hypothetical protein